MDQEEVEDTLNDMADDDIYSASTTKPKSKSASKSKKKSGRKQRKKNDKKAGASYRFNAIDIVWDDDTDLPIDKLPKNKHYDPTEMFILAKSFIVVTEAIEDERIMDVTMDCGVTTDVARKVKLIYDKTLAKTASLNKYNERTARSMLAALNKLHNGKGKYPKLHAMIEPSWSKFVEASMAPKHSGTCGYTCIIYLYITYTYIIYTYIQ